MSQIGARIPAARATKLFVLGQYMQETGIPAVEFHAPCVVRGGLRIPVLGTQAIEAYTMSEFRLRIASSEETGDGVVTLAPKSSGSNTHPQVGLPIYHPDDMTPEALAAMAESREGFAELHTSFGMELDEADRPIGTAAMFGVLNSDKVALPYGDKPMDAYLGVLEVVGKKKWEAQLATRTAARAQATVSPELVSA